MTPVVRRRLTNAEVSAVLKTPVQDEPNFSLGEINQLWGKRFNE